MVNDEISSKIIYDLCDIIHELSSPAVSLKSGFESLKNNLPAIIKLCENSQDLNCENYTNVSKRLTILSQNIDHDACYLQDYFEKLSECVKYLSFKYGLNTKCDSNTSKCSLFHCFKSACDEFPFRSNFEKSVITSYDISGDDYIICLDAGILKSIFYHLIKNAVLNIKKQGFGFFGILSKKSSGGIAVHFWDTTKNIPTPCLCFDIKSLVKFLRCDLALGICFCSEIMRSIGGEMFYNPHKGEQNEFVLFFKEGSDEK